VASISGELGLVWQGLHPPCGGTGARTAQRPRALGDRGAGAQLWAQADRSGNELVSGAGAGLVATD
jgi:hypothetical protein